MALDSDKIRGVWSSFFDLWRCIALAATKGGSVGEGDDSKGSIVQEGHDL